MFSLRASLEAVAATTRIHLTLKSRLRKCECQVSPGPSPHSRSITDDESSAAGSSIVFLRLSNNGMVLPLHIGESESHALLKEINKQKG